MPTIAEEHLRSPLRYPGGKARVAKLFSEYIPEHAEYREVFAGGAALFFFKPRAESDWLNDLHPGLYALYVSLRDRFEQFAELCREQQGDLRSIFGYWAGRKDLMVATGEESVVERAVQYFYINRTVWTGRVIYDPTRRSRLYFSNPEGWSNLDKRLAHLARISQKLQGAKITCLPFEYCLADVSKRTFMYCDPPYMRDSVCPRTDKLYDKEFTLEAHELLARLLSKSKAKVMVSYDDCPETRKLYGSKPWRIVELQWKYCGRYAMTNENKAGQIKEKKVTGNELLILNY
jgi:DNA adenine methylase